VCVFLSMNGDSQEPAAKAGEKAVEVVKKFEELYIERDYDAMLDLMAEDVKAALPFRSASKGWYIDEQIGKEDVLDKLREGREATIGYYGYPITEIDDKVEVEGEFCLSKVTFKRQYTPFIMCIACCSMTPMSFMMKDKIAVDEEKGLVISIERQLGHDL